MRKAGSHPGDGGVYSLSVVPTMRETAYPTNSPFFPPAPNQIPAEEASQHRPNPSRHTTFLYTMATISPQLAQTLAHTNLLGIFSNTDAASRKAAIRATYHPDVEFFEPDAVITNHEGIDAKVEKLLAERPGWSFVPLGPVRCNHQLVFLAWGYGPKEAAGEGNNDGGVEVKVKGCDVLMVEGDKVKRFWVLIDGASDVKV